MRIRVARGHATPAQHADAPLFDSLGSCAAPAQVLAETRAVGQDGAFSLARVYTYSDDLRSESTLADHPGVGAGAGGPPAFAHVPGAHYPLRDALGTVRASAHRPSGLTGGEASITDYRHGAFGLPLGPDWAPADPSTRGSLTTESGVMAAGSSPWAFTGQRVDPATGMQYHRARWLDTGLGRWASVDPVWDWPGNVGSATSYCILQALNAIDSAGTRGSLLNLVITASIVGTLSGMHTGVESVLDNDPETTFLGGFAVGFGIGFALTIIICLLIAKFPAIAAFAAKSWVVKSGAAAGAGLGGYSIGSAIYDRDYKLAVYRLLLLTLSIGALSSTVRGFVRESQKKLQAFFKGRVFQNPQVSDGELLPPPPRAQGTQAGLEPPPSEALGPLGSIEDDYVNLLTPERTNHVLYGDRTGGNHLFPGSGDPRNTPFPQGWTKEKILHEISDVATDPSLTWIQRTGRDGALTTRAGDPVRYVVFGERDGVSIKVVIQADEQGIITGYPAVP